MSAHPPGPLFAPPLDSPGFEWDAGIGERPELWRVAIPAALTGPDAILPDASLSLSAVAQADWSLRSLGGQEPFFGAVARAVERGPGFAVLHRLPLEGLSYRSARVIHLMLGKSFGRLQPQDSSGSLICDVMDPDMPEEEPAAAVPGRRWADLPCHTDQAFAPRPPRLLAFLCLGAAARGGAVRLVSAATLLRKVGAIDPALVAALWRPVGFARERQLDRGDAFEERVAIFEPGPAEPRFRYLHYQIAGDSLDKQQRLAITLLEEILASPGVALHLDLRPGEVLLINNAIILHGRDPYQNKSKPAGPRHHMRLWIS